MKKVFSPTPLSFDSLLFVMRLTFGFSMLLGHGIGKFNKLFQDPIKFYDFANLGPELSLYLAVFAELICSVLLILGLGTRLAALPLFITMAVAFFIVHGTDPFSERELAFCYMIIYAVFIYSGAGKYSVDSFIHSYLHKQS